jgi:putative aldouronate transport system permease protein
MASSRNFYSAWVHKRIGLRKQLVKNWELYVFLLPAVVWYAIFMYGPMYGLQIAFKDFNGAFGIMGSPWVGLKHFRNFFKSYYFWPLVWNTIFLKLYTLLASFPIPIMLALMLNEVRQYKYRKIVQTVTYAPHFISTVVLVGIIYIMLSPSYGVVNSLIKSLGGEAQSFMTNPRLFRDIYVWSNVWQNTGWSSIIYLAALSAVDPQLHEAAIIDGATRIQRIWYINIAVLLPTMTILLILQVGNLMNVGFEKVLLMQNDLIMDKADVISTYIYRRGLLRAEYSFSSAVGMFNNVINFILLLSVNEIVKKIGGTTLF